MRPVQYAHWHQFFENISVSSQDFYNTLERALSDRKIPLNDISRVEILERGPFSSKRMYLKLQRDWLTYNVCVAPFGTGFFVSSRLMVWPFRSWPQVPFLGFVIILALTTMYLCIALGLNNPTGGILVTAISVVLSQLSTVFRRRKTLTLTLTLLFLASLSLSSSVTRGNVSAPPNEMLEVKLPTCTNKGEAYLLGKALRGDFANFNSAALSPTDQEIRGAFLRDLIVYLSVQPHPPLEGLRLSNATIVGVVRLEGLTFTQPVLLWQCTFKNSVDLSNAKFCNDLDLSDSIFESGICLLKSQVGGRLVLPHKIVHPDAESFSGKILFSHLTVEDAIQCHSSCTFDGDVEFDSLRVGRAILLKGTTFLDRANFSYCKVASTFKCEACTFSKDFVMESAEVDDCFEISGTSFDGAFDAMDSRFGRVMFFPNKASTNCVFENTNIFGDLIFVGDGLAGAELNLKGGRIAGVMDIQRLGKFPSKLDLFGIRADRFYAASSNQLFSFIGLAPLSPDVYKQVESSYRNSGHEDMADEAYITLRDKERDQKGIAGWSDWILWILVRYGRQPWRVFLWGAMVVLVGGLVFHPKLMRPTDDRLPPPPFNRFWYSLDVFAPVIQLGPDHEWQPRHDIRGYGGSFVWHWIRIQRFLGWLLVPIGIAAISGLLK